MISHLLRLVWARKRSNALLILEIFISFLVIFAVALLTTSNYQRWSSPLGFSWDSVLVISSSYADMDWVEKNRDEPERTAEILRELRALPEVEAVAATFMTPFEMAFATTEFNNGGFVVSAAFNRMTDDTDEVLRLEIAEGRWFERTDDSFDWTPAVINRQLADQLFHKVDPLGQPITEEGDTRVVGVVEHFRWNGQLADIAPAAVLRLSSVEANQRPPTRFLIRTAPETPPEFEARAQRVAQSVFPEWTTTISPLEEARRFNLRMALVPLSLAVGVAGSLMAMVMLGMVGVYWQSVTGRTHEIGLRRAMGGTRWGIYGQFLTEILIVTSIGAGLASLVVLQLPLLGMLGDTGWGTILGALALAYLMIYGLSTASGLYPAWIAARIRPADALHDE